MTIAVELIRCVSITAGAIVLWFGVLGPIAVLTEQRFREPRSELGRALRNFGLAVRNEIIWRGGLKRWD